MLDRPEPSQVRLWWEEEQAFLLRAVSALIRGGVMIVLWYLHQKLPSDKQAEGVLAAVQHGATAGAFTASNVILAMDIVLLFLPSGWRRWLHL